MARKSTTKPAVIEEVDDELDDLIVEEDDDEVTESEEAEEGPVARETYTAKQVATRIGTDAKTLRKFFRSSASTVEPVGQGGRYEFDAADLPKIREEFEKWNSTKPTRSPRGTKTSTPKGRQAPQGQPVIEDDEEDVLLELDDEDDEPSAEDLAEIDEEEDDIPEED